MTEAERDRFRAEQIGYVFQTFNLLPGFTALENVLLAMRFAGRGVDRSRAKAAPGPRRAGPPHDAQAGRCSRSASSSGWRSPGRWPTSPSCCWPTSRRPTSTRATSSRSSTCCARPAARRTWRWCWSRTRPRWPDQFERVDHLEQFNRVVASGMSLWKIAWRSIQQRALASGLTAFSIGLGVALVVAVLVIHAVIDQSFRRGAQGYDLIVGPKGDRCNWCSTRSST